MSEAPYCIELRGGRFDGFRKGIAEMPAEARLEIPTDPPGLWASNSSSSRLAVYERHQVVFARLNGTPTMVLKYDFVGTRALAVGTSK